MAGSVHQAHVGEAIVRLAVVPFLSIRAVVFAGYAREFRTIAVVPPNASCADA